MKIDELDNEALQLAEHGKNLIGGVDIFRSIEFSMAIALFNPKKNDKILDVGCGGSIFPSYISKYYQSAITLTDILDVEEIQKKYFKSAGISLDGILSTNDKGDPFCNFRKEDATKLSFSDEVFDTCYAISSIEHIPSNGDTKALKEMLRVLKPGGVIVITVPFFSSFMELENASHYGGFERRYDSENLEKRFLKHVQNHKIELHYLDNKFFWGDEFNELWYKKKLYQATNENSWIFTKALFSISEISSDASRGAIIKIVKN